MNFRARALDRHGLEQAADWLAVAVVVSLPWSTSATGILVALWLLAVLSTLDFAAVRRELATAAGGLPVLLWALAAFGMLWADASWSERIGGFSSYNRLLVIPLLLAQFRRSERAMWVFTAFLASLTAVLVLSWAMVLFPALPWRASAYGVPAKDHILQSGEFLLCAFVLFAVASDNYRAGRWRLAAGLLTLAGLFLANIAFVVTARTTLLVAPAMSLLLGWRQFRWLGLLAALVLFCILGAAAVLESPPLRARLDTSATEFRDYEASDAVNSTSMHLEFIKKSLSFVKTAPIIGHGTGSIPEEFRKSAIGETRVAAVPAVNPHNQILAVAIQLGLVGAAVLVAMWIAHFMLFRGAGLAAWIGMMVVTQNIVGSLVNSHLFDFTQAWLYIFGVGVAGGMVQQKCGSSPPTAPAREGGSAAGQSS
jgi:hypothetical protein